MILALEIFTVNPFKETWRGLYDHRHHNVIESIFSFCFLDPPRVILEAGSSLNLDNLKEGDDAYFDCKVKARPEATNVQWLFDVSI